MIQICVPKYGCQLLQDIKSGTMYFNLKLIAKDINFEEYINFDNILYEMYI